MNSSPLATALLHSLTRQRERLQQSLLLQTFAVLAFVAFVQVAARPALRLSESAYRSPMFVGSFLTSAGGIASVVITVALLLSRRRNLSWSAVPLGPSLRGFIGILVGVIVWNYVTCGMNHYFDQAHLVDRALLVAFALAVLASPFATPLFVSFAFAFAFQFEHPSFLLLTWSDKSILFVLLSAFAATLLVGTIVECKRNLFLFVTLSIVAAFYAIPGAAKAMAGAHPLDWLLNNNTAYLLVNAHQNGWLGDVDAAAVVDASRWMATVDPLIRVGTVVIEIGALLLLARFRLALVVLALVIGLHLGIFFASGIFFWKWIAVDLALMGLLWRLRHDSSVVELFAQRRHFAASIVIVLASPILFSPPVLGWIDVPYGTTFDLEVVTSLGQTKPVARGDMSPYDTAFAQNRFFYLSPHSLPSIAATYGCASDPATTTALHEAGPADEVDLGTLMHIIDPSRSSRFDEKKALGFDAFIVRFFSSTNRHAKPGILRALNRFGPPKHIVTSAPPNAFAWEEQVVLVRVRMREYVYASNGERGVVHVLRDEIIREIPIPDPSGQ